MASSPTVALDVDVQAASIGAPVVGDAPAPEPLATRRPGLGYVLAKRGLDAAIAGLGLLLLAPLLAVVALLIRLHDGGPALFSQERVGRGGRRFRFFKFRSMVQGAEDRRADVQRLVQAGTVRFKLENDPRITPLGRWLRRTSLDELPQLWNVLKGDMSLVGPRPPLPEEVASYGPRERARLEVEQGLTCLWQVRGRSLLPFSEQVTLDLEYARRRGLLLDLKILLLTIPAVVGGRGAY